MSIRGKWPDTMEKEPMVQKRIVSDQRRVLLVALLQACGVSYIAGLGLAVKFGIAEPTDSVLVASWLVTLTSAWHFCSWRLAGRTSFDPYAIFLLAATLFNAGQGLLEALNLNENGILNATFSPTLLVQSLYLVSLGLASLHLGALVGVATRRTRTVQHSPEWRSDRVRATRYVGYTCLVFSIIPLFLVLRDALTVALTQGYFGLFGRRQDEMLPRIVQLMATFAMPGAMFGVAGNNRHKAPVVVCGAIILAYAGSMLTVGSRSSAVMPLVAFTWIYARWVHRLPRAVLVVAGATILGLFPLIYAVRDTPGEWQDRLQVAETVFSAHNPLVAAVSEMGGTLRTVSHTIRLIPSIRPFDLGVGYAYSVSTLFPNIGWQVHPAVAHGLFADWLIHEVDPSFGYIGGGYGYSFLAEAYANFGWIGLVPSVAIFGFLLARLAEWGRSDDDPAKSALVATFLALFLLFARGESQGVLRSLVWFSFLPYVAVCLATELLSNTVHGER